MEGESILRVPHTPIALSVWGNDFTLWAAHYRGHRKLTRAALLRADGLHADCQRDIRLAVQMGFDEARPHIVCPGNGGIHTSTEVPAARIEEWRKRLRVSSETPLVLNPRGRRLYIRTQEYLRAIPRVLALRPDTVFVSVGLAADPSTQRLARNLGLGSAHRALPTLPQEDLAALFAAATVVVSPSTHDGTPNTLLEAMAHGAFPVVGDLESIREWIEHGVNGLLVDPLRPDALAAGILRALDDKELRARAAERNRHLVRARADYATSMERVAAFYDSVIDSARARR
jgi:glycosyltransferase involved in cell wall biosynthesis